MTYDGIWEGAVSLKSLKAPKKVKKRPTDQPTNHLTNQPTDQLMNRQSGV